MPTCETCGHTEFIKESGFFYCEICHTKHEDIREEVLEARIDLSTKYRKTKIKRLKIVNSGHDLGWTSWELYNFILIGLTNELVDLGATSNIKSTVLQLWATYLGKVEVAFTSTCQKEAPRLAKRYNQRDAEILYGKLQAKKRSKRRRGTGSNPSTSIISDGTYSTKELNQNKKSLIQADYEKYMASQTNSDADSRSLLNQSVYSSTAASSLDIPLEKPRLKFSSHAKQEKRKTKSKMQSAPKNRRKIYKSAGYVSTLYKTSPYIITPMKLWAIIYLALRIHNEPIQLSDMMRYGREGHLSYYKLDHLMPEEIRLNNSYINFLSPNTEITHKGMRKTIISMAKFLNVHHLPSVNLLPLVERYCEDLELPKGILLYARRVFTLITPHIEFNSKKPFPNYEGRAMALIIIIFKLLFALDGLTESKISKIAESMNRIITKENVSSKLFSFNEWQQYIECRKAILTNHHYPTKLKYNPDTIGLKNGYYEFMKIMSSKRDQGFEITSSKHLIPQELTQTMRQCIDALNENIPPLQEVELFPPSLTPFNSYFQQFLNTSSFDLPPILRMNFANTKIGYTTKFGCLQKLAAQCGVGLDIIDSSAHFIEKIVPPFDTSRLPPKEELNEDIQVHVADGKNFVHDISPQEKVFQTIPSQVIVNTTKQKYFDSIESLDRSIESLSNDQYLYDHVSPDGKLLIGRTENSRTNTDLIKQYKNTLEPLDSVKINLNYNCSLSEKEKATLLISKTNFKANLFYSARVKKYHRNSQGKFIKSGNNDCNNITKQSYLDNAELNDTQEGAIKEKSHTRCTSKDDVILKEEIDTTVRLFRPFKDYWLYHYNVHRVRPMHFESFEKALPFNFRWLLNECACIIEMPTEDLYEELCALEIRLIGILNNDSVKQKN